MKKYIYILLLILLQATVARAQRMIPNQRGLEINAGTFSQKNPGRNYYLNIAMTVNAQHGNYQLWALEYTHEYSIYKDLRIPWETYTGEGGYSLQMFGDSRKNITLNAALTAVAGYETINRRQDALFDGSKILNEEGFIYGCGGRLSVETYLCDKIVLLMQGRAKILWGTSTRQFRPSVGIGIRFNF